MISFIPHGVFAAALIAAVWTIWSTVRPKVGQVFDALYGRPRQVETSAQRWRRIHLEADCRTGEVA